MIIFIIIMTICSCRSSKTCISYQRLVICFLWIHSDIKSLEFYRNLLSILLLTDLENTAVSISSIIPLVSNSSMDFFKVFKDHSKHTKYS